MIKHWHRVDVSKQYTIHPGHGYIVTNPTGHAIATLATLDELIALVDQLYELVWLGYRRVQAA